MSQDPKAVETAVKAALQPGVDTSSTEAPQSPSPSELALATELTLVQQELEKTQTEKENYKRGMLKAKGRDPEEPDSTVDYNDPTQLASFVKKQVEETLHSTRETELEQKKAKIVNELILAHQNRMQVSSTGQGGDTTPAKPSTDPFWSQEQLAYFKSRNLDPDKVRQNYDQSRR